jgi:hypothetical protein
VSLQCLRIMGLRESAQNHHRHSDILASASEVRKVFTIVRDVVVDLTHAGTRAACGRRGRVLNAEFGTLAFEPRPLGIQVDTPTLQALGAFALVRLLLRRCKLGRRLVVATRGTGGGGVSVTSDVASAMSTMRHSRD